MFSAARNHDSISRHVIFGFRSSVCAHDEWEIILFFLVDAKIKNLLFYLPENPRETDHDEDDFFPFIEKRFSFFFSNSRNRLNTIDPKKEEHEELFKTHGFEILIDFQLLEASKQQKKSCVRMFFYFGIGCGKLKTLKANCER